MAIFSFKDALVCLYHSRSLGDLCTIDGFWRRIQKISLQKDFTNLEVETSQDVHWEAAAKLFETNKRRHTQLGGE